MNKWQIICPVALMALFVLFSTPAAIRRHNMNRRDRIAFSTHGVARELEATTNSMLLVSLTPALKQALGQFLTTPTRYDDTFRSGDEPAPVGDGTATHRLYMRNHKDDYLTLRLKYDPKLKKFQVLGFWNPTLWPDPTN
jgi:hypothetical protein